MLRSFESPDAQEHTILHRGIRDRRAKSHRLFEYGYPEHPLPLPSDDEALREEVAENLRFVWDGGHHGASRYSDGSWSVLYTACDRNTAIKELIFHRIESLRSIFQSEGKITTDVIVAEYEVKGRWKEYFTLSRGYLCGEEADVLKRCRDVARNIRESEFKHIRVPSARSFYGICAPVFCKSTLMDFSSIRLLTINAYPDRIELLDDGNPGEIIFQID